MNITFLLPSQCVLPITLRQLPVLTKRSSAATRDRNELQPQNQQTISTISPKRSTTRNSLVIIIHEAATKCLPPMVLVGAPLEHISRGALPHRKQDLELPKQIALGFVLAPIDALQTKEKCSSCFDEGVHLVLRCPERFFIARRIKRILGVVCSRRA